MGTPIEASADIAYLKAVVPEMRKLHVRRFGELELDPEPLSVAAEDEAAERDATQRKPITPDQREQIARTERRRVALAASGGLIPRIERQ